MEMKMKIEGQVLGLKANNNGHSGDIHNAFVRNFVLRNINRFQEDVIVDDLIDKEETAIAVISLLSDNGKGTT
jgi:hypothetical protein